MGNRSSKPVGRVTTDVRRRAVASRGVAKRGILPQPEVTATPFDHGSTARHYVRARMLAEDHAVI